MENNKILRNENTFLKNSSNRFLAEFSLAKFSATITNNIETRQSSDGIV